SVAPWGHLAEGGAPSRPPPTAVRSRARGSTPARSNGSETRSPDVAEVRSLLGSSANASDRASDRRRNVGRAALGARRARRERRRRRRRRGRRRVRPEARTGEAGRLRRNLTRLDPPAASLLLAGQRQIGIVPRDDRERAGDEDADAAGAD